jgi:hypothetical protein
MITIREFACFIDFVDVFINSQKIILNSSDKYLIKHNLIQTSALILDVANNLDQDVYPEEKRVLMGQNLYSLRESVKDIIEDKFFNVLSYSIEISLNIISAMNQFSQLDQQSKSETTNFLRSSANQLLAISESIE